MYAICLITFQPNKTWCDFLNLFNQYKIFIIVDDNNFDLSDFINNYNNITFIKVDNDKCKLNGYIDCSTSFTINKLISGWDKALYYFGIEEKKYDYIWYMEDDVLFYNENTIINIDNQYINDDLLSNTFEINSDGNKNTWLWKLINIQQYSPPYYKGMMCCVRFSKKMLSCINDYAYKYKTLFYLEALFPTITIKNNLKYSNPVEFNKIYYRHNFKGEKVDMNIFYHPVKDLNKHISFRNL
uniref:Nucleotide-diphospho-sugar transferase domain-containing protein n=1 Tax=viral metagenome TaxID=1070528 RepID=A0A6C0B293_9ZZZZ